MADPIDNVLKKEGGLSSNPADTGGNTFEGISQRWNPDLWKNGPPSDAAVRARYEAQYVKSPGFDQIPDKQLQAQLIDFGVNSGPAVAIQKLQRIVGVTEDGVLGPGTLAAMGKLHPEEVNNLVVAERVRLIGRIVSKNPSQLTFLNGWLDRALQFLE